MAPTPQELQRTAEQLKRQPGRYWKSFPVSALMGWLWHKGCCVYCGTSLVDAVHMVHAHGSADHLLPRTYSDLDWARKENPTSAAVLFINCVPACASCNGLKKHFDPNMPGGGQLYTRGDTNGFSPEVQLEFIRRAKQHIESQRQKRQAEFESDLSAWNKAMDSLYGPIGKELLD